MSCFFNFKDKLRLTRGPEVWRKSNGLSSERRDKSSRSAPIGESPRTKSSTSSANSTRTVSEIYNERARNLTVFSFSKLRHATDNFSRALKIGEGGFGSIYRGTITCSDGNGEGQVEVAVKVLKRDSSQGHKQWVAEIQFLGVLEHPNLVKLIGYCGEDTERGMERLLVYELMPNKSLEDHLFNRAYPTLSWQARLEILLGAARGLAYLHEGLEVQVIHRDFKSSNVLLDENFKPKLSDFGLAREGPAPDRTHVTTKVVGTHGYAAPDYVETGHLTTKSDVWSFGVVLYEALAGRPSLNQKLPKSEQKILEWVKQFPASSKKFSTIIDPRLENQFSVGAAREVARLADRCLARRAKSRPKMSEVVEKLQEIIQASSEVTEAEPSPPSPERKDNTIDPEKDSNTGPGKSESWKRRMAQLEKLAEHVEGDRARKFMTRQRANVQLKEHVSV
ncbi:hypothetical protein MLD38_038545 [Melastoma candidum]|uniref:Uncharacterized protein n=1 Tax=Melastoma candidum TaxID=119954 RepID=A0ACB9KZ90_9MYRT|nr:hypothetical protein MLD38_038545 [Melastoma candidum]